MKTMILTLAILCPVAANADGIADITHFDDAFGSTGLYALGYERELAGYAFNAGVFSYKSDATSRKASMSGQFVGAHRRFSNAFRVKSRLYLNQTGPNFGNVTVFGETNGGVSHEENCERDFADLSTSTYFQGCAVSVGLTKGKVYGSASAGQYSFSDGNARGVATVRAGYSVTDSTTVEVFSKRSRDDEPSVLYFSPDRFTSTRLMARHVFTPTDNLSMKVGVGGGPESISGSKATAKYADLLVRYDRRNTSVFLKAEHKQSPSYSYNYYTASITIRF